MALIALATVTHSVNTGQRYEGLEFEVLGGGALRLVGPLNGNHAPPGHHMLFILNRDGIPSVAQLVQVGPFKTGDIDGNGSVGIGDLLLLFASWGPCAGCDADLNGDGVVNVADMLIQVANWG